MLRETAPDQCVCVFVCLFPSRITYVQSSPGVAAPMPLVSTATVSSPQQIPPPSGPTFLPPSLATLGFTAIAPAGQALVQPIAAGEKKTKTNFEIIVYFPQFPHY